MRALHTPTEARIDLMVDVEVARLDVVERARRALVLLALEAVLLALAALLVGGLHNVDGVRAGALHARNLRARLLPEQRDLDTVIDWDNRLIVAPPIPGVMGGLNRCVVLRRVPIDYLLLGVLLPPACIHLTSQIVDSLAIHLFLKSRSGFLRRLLV